MMRSLGIVFGVGMVLGLGGLLAIPQPLQEPKPMFNRVRASDLPMPCSNQAWPMADRRCATWTAPRTADKEVADKIADKPKAVPVEQRPAKAEQPVLAAQAEPVVQAEPVAQAEPVPNPTPVQAEAQPPVATFAERLTEAPTPVATFEQRLAAPMLAAPAPARPAFVESGLIASTPVTAETVGDALAQAEPPAAPQAAETRPRKVEKPRQPEKSRAAIQVTVQTADRSRRTVTIKPTSQQDALYYAARRTVGIGGSFPAW
jgi:hypothetical protein